MHNRIVFGQRFRNIQTNQQVVVVNKNHPFGFYAERGGVRQDVQPRLQGPLVGKTVYNVKFSAISEFPNLAARYIAAGIIVVYDQANRGAGAQLCDLWHADSQEFRIESGQTDDYEFFFLEHSGQIINQKVKALQEKEKRKFM
jgi:hypothetical protein